MLDELGLVKHDYESDIINFNPFALESDIALCPRLF